MNRLPSPCAASLVLVALSSMFSAEPAAAVERWRCASTSHFALYSTADADSVLRTASELERMAEILRMWGLGSRSTIRQKVVLLAFADEKAFRRNWFVVAGKRVSSAGYVMTLPFGKWIGYAEYDPRGRAVAHHEYAHTLVSEEFLRAPLCLNEGLAEYLSTFTARSDHVEFGHDLEGLRYMVLSRPLFSMDELFGVEYGSPAYRGGEERVRFYSESWGLVQYLSRTGGTWPQLRQFARATASGTPPRAAFAAAYPQEAWDGLENRVRGYLSAREPEPKQIGFGSPLGDIRVDLREAPRAEALAHIGLWRAMSAGLDTAETERMFDEALTAAPDLALARAGRGVLMMSASRPAAGLAELRAASLPGTREALALSVAGLAMMNEALGGDSTRREPLLLEAGDILERSVAADSSDARALAGYVVCRVRSGDFSPLVISRLLRVAPAVPDDPDIQRMREAIAEHEVPDSPGAGSGGPSEESEPAEPLPRFGDYVYVEDLPEVIAKASPEYPEEARSKGIQGVVLVQALVGKDGRVVDVRIVKSIPELDDYASRAVRQWRFKPALTKGQPVAVWVAVPVRFPPP